jgi:predicted nucleotidyltransferase
MDPATLVTARERLLETADGYFAREPGVVAVYLGGSLPAGTADAYSDIDLRVVVEADRHKDFVRRRLEIPRRWDGFLFNEWLEGAIHCVSHFRPFLKIDIFYLDQSTLAPSPWLTLPVGILHDPQHIVADVVARSHGLVFAPAESEIARSLGKGIAALHEAYRRIRRSELIHAQTLLDELRYHMALADDWAHSRPPCGVVLTRFERRASPAVLEAMAASYVSLEDEPRLDGALRVLADCYRGQVIALHERFRLDRERDRDLEAIDIVLRML